jgi:hypothetical protein
MKTRTLPADGRGGETSHEAGKAIVATLCDEEAHPVSHFIVEDWVRNDPAAEEGNEEELDSLHHERNDK